MTERPCMKWIMKKNVKKEKGVLPDFDGDPSIKIITDDNISPLLLFDTLEYFIMGIQF